MLTKNRKTVKTLADEMTGNPSLQDATREATALFQEAAVQYQKAVEAANTELYRSAKSFFDEATEKLRQLVLTLFRRLDSLLGFRAFLNAVLYAVLGKYEPGEMRRKLADAQESGQKVQIALTYLDNAIKTRYQPANQKLKACHNRGTIRDKFVPLLAQLEFMTIKEVESGEGAKYSWKAGKPKSPPSEFELSDPLGILLLANVTESVAKEKAAAAGYTFEDIMPAHKNANDVFIFNEIFDPIASFGRTSVEAFGSRSLELGAANLCHKRALTKKLSSQADRSKSAWIDWSQRLGLFIAKTAQRIDGRLSGLVIPSSSPSTAVSLLADLRIAFGFCFGACHSPLNAVN